MSTNQLNTRAMMAKLWAKKWILLGIWAVVAIAAYGATYLLKVQYDAETEFIPEYNMQEWKALQEVVWDMNIEGSVMPSGTVLSPSVYGGIISGKAYIDTLSAKTVTLTDGTEVDIRKYYTEVSKLTKEPSYYEDMEDFIQCDQTRRRSTVTITATASDPQVAAQIANHARLVLEDFIVRNLTATRQRNLQHYAKVCETDATNALARTLYEWARIDAEQHQPVFSVLREAVAPMTPVAPRRIAITLIALLVAVLSSVIWVWRKDIAEWM